MVLIGMRISVHSYSLTLDYPLSDLSFAFMWQKGPGLGLGIYLVIGLLYHTLPLLLDIDT